MFTFESTLAPLSVPAPADPTTATPRLVTQALGRPPVQITATAEGSFGRLQDMQISSVGGGTADQSSPAQIRAMQLQTSPPDNEIPVVLPAAAVLGRTGDVAIAVTGFRLFSTGIQLDLIVRLRTEPAGPLRYRLHDLIGIFGPGDDSAGDQRLLLGLEYADGQTATNLTGPGWWAPGGAEPDPQHPTLMPTGGGGGDRSFDQSYWLTPVPPPGPLSFVCAWPAFQITETRTVLDLSGLAEASSAVQELWPWEPPEDRPREPVAPQVPADSWFARAGRTPAPPTGTDSDAPPAV